MKTNIEQENVDLRLQRDCARNACADLTAEKQRLEANLAASRENERIAREARDKLLVHIFQVAKLCERDGSCYCGCAQRAEGLKEQIRAVLEVCPKCGVPCGQTH